MGVSENAIVSNVSLTLVDEQPLPPMPTQDKYPYTPHEIRVPIRALQHMACGSFSACQIELRDVMALLSLAAWGKHEGDESGRVCIGVRGCVPVNGGRVGCGGLSCGLGGCLLIVCVRLAWALDIDRMVGLCEGRLG